jgi:hydroxymethylbilane synthase
VAGVQRLGLDASLTQVLEPDIMLPAPGQGALAVQCRADDTRVLGLLSLIDEEAVRRAVTAERRFLEYLGGGCSAPVGALAEAVPGAEDCLQMRGVVASPDGAMVLRVQGRDTDPVRLAESLAEDVSAQGAKEILDGIQAA